MRRRVVAPGACVAVLVVVLALAFRGPRPVDPTTLPADIELTMESDGVTYELRAGVAYRVDGEARYVVKRI